VSAKLREERLQPEERPQSRLMELQRVWEEGSNLQEKVVLAQSEVSSL